MNINYVEWRGIPPPVKTQFFISSTMNLKPSFPVSIPPVCPMQHTPGYQSHGIQYIVHVRVGVSSLLTQFYSKIVERKRHLLVLGGIKVRHRIRSI